MIKHITLLLTFSMALIGCPQKSGKSHLDTIKASGQLRVGTTGDYKPFTHKNENTGEYSGVDLDLMELLAAKIGVQLEIVDTTWPTLMDDFKANKFDFAISGITQTKKREVHSSFSAPYHQGGKVAFGRCKDSTKYESFENLNQPNVRFIVNPGGTNESFTRSIVKSAKVILHKDNKSIFDEIIGGRADVMISDSIEVDILSKRYKGVLCQFSKIPFKESLHNIAIMLPKDQTLKKYVDSWLLDLKHSGELQKIFNINIHSFSKNDTSANN